MKGGLVNRYLAYALVLTLVASFFSATLPAIQPSYASHESITVEVADDIDTTYDEDESVVIEGILDDVQDDLDTVEITILDGDGGNAAHDADVGIVSDDEFEYVFEVTSSDDDGVYSVQVEYDGESAFTYFIVDKDEDAIDLIIDETSYSTGDQVDVAGQIEDLVTDETEVEFIVLDPNNDEIEEGTADLGDGTLDSDEFEFDFDLGADADHGRYAIIVSYDSEDQQGFFLFEIEDDGATGGGGSSTTDPDSGTDGDITAELDEAEYAPEDTVTISGEIDNYVTTEDLGIVVTNPDDEEVAVEDDVSVQSNGDFEFDFDLDDSADEGEYIVTITYDTDELELTFDVDEGATGGGGSSTTDPDSGTDGDITAELDEAEYAPEDTVTISGEIDNYVTTEDLGIVVTNPDDEEVAVEDDVSVQSNGDFEFDFDLDDSAEEGEYIVTITYDTDELELTFDVDEGATGGGGGGTSSSVTAKLDKTSYLAGELITVTGTVSTLVEDEPVSVLLYRPDGRVVLGASKYVDPDTDRTFSTTVRLSSDLEAEDDYSIDVGYDGDSVEIEFDITGKATNTSGITVQTDKATYVLGSTVRITGTVSDDVMVGGGQQLLLRINTPDNDPCRFDPVDLESDGSYSYSLVLGGKCGLNGEYDVIAIYNQEEVETTFELTGGQQSATSYNLQAGGKSYIINYEISNATITSMTARDVDDKLIILMAAEQDGQLTLVLPREVIDAIQDGEDIDYLVTVEDETGEIVTVDVEESANTEFARTLVIDYPSDVRRIEIAGTQAVPEFGTIIAIVLALSIVGIIFATSGRFNGNRTFGLFGH